MRGCRVDVLLSKCCGQHCRVVVLWLQRGVNAAKDSWRWSFQCYRRQRGVLALNTLCYTTCGAFR